MAATLKTGYLPLFTSPRNSLDGQKNLLEKTECGILLTTVEMQTQVKSIQEVMPDLKVFTAPTANEVFDPSLDVPKYEGRHSRDVKAPGLIIHTSGSTGQSP